MNCAGKLTVEVRTACSEKWLQLPLPAAKPSSTKAAITISLVDVSTFCTMAARPTPKQFRMVNAAINPQAASWPPPRRSENAPEPTTSVALACLRLGKKYPR